MNEELKKAIEEQGLKGYCIAKKLGLAPQTFSNKLNHVTVWCKGTYTHTYKFDDYETERLREMLNLPELKIE